MEGHSDPAIAAEIGFFEGESREPNNAPESAQSGDVGRIDHVLVHPGTKPMRWCALEVQAVYFSGPAMGSEFRAIAAHEGPGIPFPTKLR
jgi:hypothetical protein